MYAIHFLPFIITLIEVHFTELSSDSHEPVGDNINNADLPFLVRSHDYPTP